MKKPKVHKPNPRCYYCSCELEKHGAYLFCQHCGLFKIEQGKWYKVVDNTLKLLKEPSYGEKEEEKKIRSKKRRLLKIEDDVSDEQGIVEENEVDRFEE